MRALICLLLTFSALAAVPAARAQITAADLPARPRGPGAPVGERSVWDPLAATAQGKALIAAAGRALDQPMPAFDGALYQEYFTTGNRSRFQNHNRQRWQRLNILVKGECLEGKGRFLGAISKTIESLCKDPSWCLPAHDHGAWIFKGNKPFVDLGVATNGADMATAIWLLGARLPPATVQLARENVGRRLTGPVLEQIRGEDPEFYRKRHWWAAVDYNWNAVCTAGSVSAILMLEESAEVRAMALRWADQNMQRFLGGFADDGYCSEGLGYWGYGFRSFTILAAIAGQQTNGKLSWLGDPRVPRIIQAALGQQLGAHAYPAFADATLDVEPDPTLVAYLARLGLCPAPAPAPTPAGFFAQSSGLLEPAVFALVVPAGGDAPAARPLPVRTWLPDGGVYVGRGCEAGDFAVAWKGGHNNEHHNHNDVGTTVVHAGGAVLLCDPGSMEYTSKTFSNERYSLPIMSSFGHAVPVVGGIYQAPGAAARARVLTTELTPAADRIRMDLSACYPVDGIQQLERTWTFSRAGSGTLTVDDQLAAAAPLAFETAWLTTGEWRKLADDTFLAVGAKQAAVALRIRASAAFTTEVLRIASPNRPEVRRLAIRLRHPQAAATITTTIIPATQAQLAAAKPLAAADAPAKVPGGKAAN